MNKVSPTLRKAAVLLAAIGMLLVSTATAEQNCAPCIERKRTMCAQECALVPPAKSLVCQRDCAFQYCSHRCKPDDQSLSDYKELTCSQCLDTQFGLCASQCEVGSDRMRAMCKMRCSDTRCTGSCLGEKPTSAPKKPEDIDDDYGDIEISDEEIGL